MTVAELIAELQKYDPSETVLLEYDSGYLSNPIDRIHLKTVKHSLGRILEEGKIINLTVKAVCLCYE